MNESTEGKRQPEGQIENQVCSLPTCSLRAVGMFREMPLCKPHLEIARTFEWFFVGAVRIPTIAEIRQARGTKDFAEYALDDFLAKNVKYGAIDFRSGEAAYRCRSFVRRLIQERRLKIYTFQRGANSYSPGDATLYFVREELEEKETFEDFNKEEVSE